METTTNNQRPANLHCIEAARLSLEFAHGKEVEILVQVESRRRQHAELTDNKKEHETALAAKNEAHARAVLSGERRGAHSQEIAELNHERDATVRALQVLEEEIAAAEAQLKTAREETAQAELKLAFAEYDGAMMDADSALKSFFESTVAPLIERTTAARKHANQCESRVNSANHFSLSTEGRRPGNNARWMLAAYERWVQGKPI